MASLNAPNNTSASPGEISKTPGKFDEILVNFVRLRSITLVMESVIDMPNVADFPDECKIDIKHYESPLLWQDHCCIYEVPENLRKHKESFYTPKFVSIGPIHHKSHKLKAMEKLKRTYMKSFESRQFMSKASIEDYKSFLERHVEVIRSCYFKKYDDGDIFYHKEKEENQLKEKNVLKEEDQLKEENPFVNMIMLDAVFIMELFLRSEINNPDQGTDPLFTKPWLMLGVKKDLLLLENQLPMFVLVKLYDNCIPDFLKGEEHCKFHDLAYKFFDGPKREDLPISVYNESKHFTDMLRYLRLPEDYKDLLRIKKGEIYLLKRATKLDEAGITIEKQEKNYMRVEFKKKGFLNIFPFLGMIPKIKCFKARLLVPEVLVDENTEIYNRNVIALEYCHYPYEQYISSHIALLDRLIDTPKDAELLQDKKIINHMLGSNKQVAYLFNHFLRGVHISFQFYGDEIQAIHDHCESKWNLGMGKLKSVYFCDQWRGSLTVLAIVVFFFSVFNSIHAFIRSV